ncbi:MAG TPA: hypothetical protein VKZ98_00925 [Aquaticitalea sp.]|nr:hypothetical protein [Aquaticitalea sp.]
MKEFVKFAIKASIGLVAIGVGTKLGKDAINNLKEFKNQRNQESNGNIG